MDFTIQNNKDTRSGFGEGLLEAGRRNPKVVAFCADLTGSLKMGDFAKEFPERFFQTGIAEANMINMAAGMALSGFVPFTGTFAAFSTGRVYDQIRQSVAYSNKNVKIAASHAGVTLGEDGATHQILEDIGLMKLLPNMTVIVPCDFNQTKNATIAAAEYDGPVYLRFGRPKVPNFTPVTSTRPKTPPSPPPNTTAPCTCVSVARKCRTSPLWMRSSSSERPRCCKKAQT